MAVDKNPVPPLTGVECLADEPIRPQTHVKVSGSEDAPMFRVENLQGQSKVNSVTSGVVPRHRKACELIPSFVCHFQPCMSPIDRVRFVSDVFHGRCTSHAALGGTNSGGVVHDN